MGEVIPFPPPVVRFHIAPHPPEAAPAARRQAVPLLAVEHDGAVHSLATLLARLPDMVLDELDAVVPRSAQEAWDLVVRRWPRIADAAARAPRDAP